MRTAIIIALIMTFACAEPTASKDTRSVEDRRIEAAQRLTDALESHPKVSHWGVTARPIKPDCSILWVFVDNRDHEHFGALHFGMRGFQGIAAMVEPGLFRGIVYQTHGSEYWFPMDSKISKKDIEPRDVVCQ